MSAKRLIVESAVRAALKEASGLQVISAEAVEYVNERAVAAVDYLAEKGRRTPGGRLMAPETGSPGPVVVRNTEPAATAAGRKLPERLCARAKEFAALPPEQQVEHLHKIYVAAPAINEAAIDLLRQVAEEPAGLFAHAASLIVISVEDLRT